MKTSFLLLLLWIAVPSVQAQDPPGTDILLLTLPRDGTAPHAEDAVKVTDRAGYDNQPTFTPDGNALLYTSMRDGQTDIYRYFIRAGRHIRLTHTQESEYSPAVVPDGTGFSVIRVEADGTQRLWRFDLPGDNPTLLFPALKPVGYQVWGDEQTVAVFVLGDPPTLQIADLRTGKADTLAQNIGRSLHRVPGQHAISFVHKTGPESWWIKQLNLDTHVLTTLAQTLPGREDYAWHPDGTLLMADGAVLYTWNRKEGAWKPLADFSVLGVTDITRLALSSQGTDLALVVNRPGTP